MRTVAALSAGVAVAAWWWPTRRIPVGRGGAALAAAGAALGILAAAILVESGAPAAVAAAAGTMAVPAPAALARARRRIEAARTAARWPDLIAAVRGRVGAGAPIPEAVRAAGRHIGGRFAELDGGLGLAFADFMEVTRRRWADPTADRALMTFAAAATTGGARVDGMLGRLADSLAGELRLRRAHDAALTQQRLTATVALLAPWAILALSLATNPTAAAAYATPLGERIVIGGLAATVAGYLLASRAARLSRPPRLFG